MALTRRGFLGTTLVLAAAAAVRGQVSAPSSAPNARASDDPFGRPSFGAPKFNPRDLMAANQKNIRKDVARLSDIVQQLQKQLEDNDIKDVLPLDVIRETDEIQKLAKHINSLVRG